MNVKAAFVKTIKHLPLTEKKMALILYNLNGIEDAMEFVRAIGAEEPVKLVHCSKCGKPCAIVHDLDISACCYAKTEIGEKET